MLAIIRLRALGELQRTKGSGVVGDNGGEAKIALVPSKNRLFVADTLEKKAGLAQRNGGCD